jgi:hypothetical protein
MSFKEYIQAFNMGKSVHEINYEIDDYMIVCRSQGCPVDASNNEYCIKQFKRLEDIDNDSPKKGLKKIIFFLGEVYEYTFLGVPPNN